MNSAKRALLLCVLIAAPAQRAQAMLSLGLIGGTALFMYLAGKEAAGKIAYHTVRGAGYLTYESGRWVFHKLGNLHAKYCATSTPEILENNWNVMEEDQQIGLSFTINLSNTYERERLQNMLKNYDPYSNERGRAVLTFYPQNNINIATVPLMPNREPVWIDDDKLLLKNDDEDNDTNIDTNNKMIELPMNWDDFE